MERRAAWEGRLSGCGGDGVGEARVMTSRS
jgi:hypothetical protein